MAHGRQAVLALALALAGLGARAVELGALEVASALGEPLDARVPLVAASGERFEAACFYLSHAGLPEGARLAMTLERSARGTALRIRGATPLEVPAATLQVSVACPGREPQPAREYALLLDPRSRVRAPTVAGTAPPAVGATILAREGATMDSIARTMVPGDAPARAAYLEALAAANPNLASRAPTATIEAGTPVALPELRTYAATRRAAGQGQIATAREALATPSARAERAPVAAAPVETELPPPPARPPATRPARPAMAAVPPAERAPASAPAVAGPAPPPPPPTVTPPATPNTATRAKTPGDRESAFVLRLSGAEIDLTRSRGVDDRRRAQLRERQLVLDADDQLSAMLAMKHSLKQLEARVSELQLKLAGMPASFPERPAPAKPAAVAPVEPPRTAPALPDRPRAPEPAPSQATKAPSPAPASAPPPAPAAAATPAPTPPVTAASTPPTATREAPVSASSAPPAATPGPASPVAAVPPPATWWRDYGPWLAGLGAMLLLAVAFALWRRRAAAREETLEETDDAALPEAEAPVVGDVGEIAAPVVAAPPEPARASISSDASLPTRLRDTDSGELRRRYIEERFPEVASRAIRLEDTASVVKGARLFYEDGELSRAVELLQLAIEARPEEPKLWLALFEIFRLERLAGEFGELARRFQEKHGESEHWRKVQFFGREVDPGNPLYKVEPVATLETIGPREGRNLAAASAAFDPIAENWLNAPMDFENEVLANDLRRSLMAEAGIAEQDLTPAPMTALRNVEMFTVA